MTTFTMPPSEAEIQAEIALLRTMSVSIRPFSAFGDDNRATVAAQLEVIEQRLSMPEIERRWPQDDIDCEERRVTFLEHVQDAHNWFRGLDDAPPPSEGWLCLMPGAPVERPSRLETSRAHLC